MPAAQIATLTSWPSSTWTKSSGSIRSARRRRSPIPACGVSRPTALFNNHLDDQREGRQHPYQPQPRRAYLRADLPRAAAESADRGPHRAGRLGPRRPGKTTQEARVMDLSIFPAETLALSYEKRVRWEP